MSDVPEGWKLVPIEPTQEMCDVGIRARAEGWGSERIANAYRAMIKAAPVSPAKEGSPE